MESKTNDIFLRITPQINKMLRDVAKKEERKINTVMIRALKHYLKLEHNVNTEALEE
jgi:hypothetical protein